MRQQLDRTVRLMNDAIPDAMVEGYEDLIEGLTLPHKMIATHFTAAAIRANASVIVTLNERDFPEERLAGFDIEAQPS